MLSSKAMKELLSNSKGRVSKILNMSRSLDEVEVLALNGLYETIDNIILWDKKLTKNKTTRFKNTLKDYYALISSTKRDYIRKHINPLIEKLLGNEWN